MAGDRQRFDKVMNQGHSAVWDQSWDKAASYYRQALEEFPEDPKALTSLALALFELGDLKESLINYQRAVKVTPDDPIPMEKIGALLERLGRADQAIDAYMRSAELYIKNREVNKSIEIWQQVIGLNPEYLMAHSRLGLIYERLDRKAEAVNAYLAMASLFQHGGDLQKATQAVTHALQILPGSSEAGQALNMLKMGRLLPRPAQARRSLDPAFTADTETPALPVRDEAPDQDPVAAARQKAISSLASILFDSMSGESTSSSGMQAIMRGSGSSASGGQVDSTRMILHLNQVIDSVSRKEESQAIEELNQALDAGLDHPAAHFLLGALLDQAGRMESAVRNLQHAAQTPDFAMGANLLLGQILLRLGRVPSAAAALLEALKYADLQSVPEHKAAELAQMYNSLIEAQTTQESAPQSLCDGIIAMIARPDWLEQVAKARKQISAQQGNGALTPVADLLAEASSGGIVESLSHIQQLIHLGKYRSAMEEAFLAVEIAPTYLPLHIVMGDLLVRQGMISDASNKYLMIARGYNSRGEVGREIDLYRRVLEFSPVDVKVRELLITRLQQTGQIEEAVKEYIRQADSYYALADIGNVRSTLTHAFKIAQEQNLGKGTRAQILKQMADIDMQSLDWRQAVRTYEQIRALQPDDTQTRQTLIDLFFRLGQENQASAEIGGFVKHLLEQKQQNQAIEFLEKLIVDFPEQPVVVRSLADTYRHIGRIEDAIRRYDSAGELYLNAGNKQAAAEAIMAILSLNPPNADEYQQLLSQLRS